MSYLRTLPVRGRGLGKKQLTKRKKKEKRGGGEGKQAWRLMSVNSVPRKGRGT